jgi:hypothetical protein
MARRTLAALVACTSVGVMLWTASSGAATHAAPAAPSAPPPVLTLAAQSPYVLPSQSLSLRLNVNLPTANRVGTTLSVTVYDKLHSRSGFGQTLEAGPTGVLDPAQSVSVPATGPVVLSLPVLTEQATRLPPGPPAIGLGCTADTGTCPGVYPVTVTLTRHGSPQVIGRLTTYLTYEEGQSASPLRVALVVPFADPVRIEHTADAAVALTPPSAAQVRDLVALAALLGGLAPNPAGGVPVTVLADPHTVQGLLASGDASARRAVATLSSLSTAAGDQFPDQPFVPVDVGALAGGGLTGEVRLQMDQGDAILRAAAIHVEGPLALVRGGIGTNLATGLQLAGANRVIVPDTSVSDNESHSGITQPFGLELGHSVPVEAAAADSELAAHFVAHHDDPVLAANQLLADLALIHSEEPNAADPRGVVLVPPASWAPSVPFLETVFEGLAANPVVRAVTVRDYFATVPRGGSFPGVEPSVRRPAASGPGPSVAHSVADSVANGRRRYIAFRSAVQGDPAILGQLADLLLASQSDELTPAHQLAGTATYERALAGQLATVQLATDRTITLTARTGPIPVTVLSSAHFVMVGTLSLASDKLQFPEGSSRSDFVVHPNTNSVRILVQARTSGDLPLTVTLTSPTAAPGSPPLVITRGQLTVRSTATSLVGIVLTAAAAAVLVVWWIRTWRRGRAKRAGPAHPGTGAP